MTVAWKRIISYFWYKSSWHFSWSSNNHAISWNRR